VKLGATSGTSWNDSGLQNGRDYYYVVIPKGGHDACFGPASSCTTVAPAAGPGLDIDPDPTGFSLSGGDSDEFIDNCEDATVTIEVRNSGIGSLTNVRITAVSVVSPSGTSVSTTFPAVVSPSTLAQGATGTGGFDFTAGGLSFGDTLVLEVTVNADELSGPQIQTLTFENAESSLQSVASQTWDFESDLDGWALVQGTFNQATTGGGAGGSSGYLASSDGLDEQCDQVRSPVFQLTSSSTMTLQSNYEIENASSGQWWDIANIAVFEDNLRSSVNPDGGRLYNATGEGASCVTAGQDGWASVNNSWGPSDWSTTALDSAGRAGRPIQLDVAYGTDFSLNGKGFWFDKVTLTDIEFLVADGQSNDCNAVCVVDADCDNGFYCDGPEVCSAAGVCEAGPPPICDDDLFCNGVASCNEATDSCDPGTPPACDNGLFCDGPESCNESTDSCDAGTPPNPDDGVACTDDSCNETTDQLENTANNANCDNGLFCDGAETCDVNLDCQAGTDPCLGGDCDEAADSCPIPAVEMHMGDLNGVVTTRRNRWDADVTFTVHDAEENMVAGAIVVANWVSGANGSVQCETDVFGACTVNKNSLKNNVSSVTLEVSSITRGSDTYDSGANHDPDDPSDSDGTTIVVYRDGPPVAQPPVAVFTYSCNLLDCSFDGSGSTDPDGGGIVSYEWDFGGTGTSSVATPDHSFPSDDEYNVTLTVTDDEGETGSTSQNVTVYGTSIDMHVGDLDGSTEAVRNKWNVTVTITVHDDAPPPHNTVSGATVNANWTSGTNGSGSCVTGSSGTCTIGKSNLKSNVSNVTLQVTGVTRGSDTYSEGTNHDPDSDSDGTIITVNKP
jgi:hypothetical protein